MSEICYSCFTEKSTAGACPRCGYDPASDEGKYPFALRAGAILNGRYIVGRVIGQGGFGITYLAQDYRTKGLVAIKEYLPTEFAGRTTGTYAVQVYSGDRRENFEYGKEQFLAEAKTLAEFIGNDHIVRIYSYFEEYDTAYFAMEYIDGESLDKYMRRFGGRLTVEQANELLIPVMEALDWVHSKGIVHRDIAPDNIIVTKDGRAKLIDFGAARYSTGEKSKSLDVILKHGFAPKEQYIRRGRQGPFTDVYAMAATYYYAITGKIPPESIERIDEDELIPPTTLGVKISEKAENALLKGLEVSASERYQRMGELAGGLGAKPVRQASEQQAGLSFIKKGSGIKAGFTALTGGLADTLNTKLNRKNADSKELSPSPSTSAGGKSRFAALSPSSAEGTSASSRTIKAGVTALTGELTNALKEKLDRHNTEETSLGQKLKMPLSNFKAATADKSQSAVTGQPSPALGPHPAVTKPQTEASKTSGPPFAPATQQSRITSGPPFAPATLQSRASKPDHPVVKPQPETPSGKTSSAAYGSGAVKKTSWKKQVWKIAAMAALIYIGILIGSSVSSNKSTDESGKLTDPVETTYSSGEASSEFWTFDNATGTLYINYEGDMPDTSYGRPWTQYGDDIKKIIISDSVTSISDSAFSELFSLSSVTIPGSVENIGWNAFGDCYELTEVNIGNGVKTIGAWAFSSCHSLKSIVLPDSITSIGWNAFFDCKNLSDVSIPPHAVIEEGAFSGTLLDAESTATAAATTEKVIPGEFIEQQNVSMGKTCPFKLDTTARNQSGVILEHYIEYEGYFPFGTWYLYAKTEGGSWDHIAEFTITEDDIGKYVTYDLTFDKPETFDYLALCAGRYAGEYSATFDAIYYYK